MCMLINALINAWFLVTHAFIRSCMMAFINVYVHECEIYVIMHAYIRSCVIALINVYVDECEIVFITVYVDEGIDK